MRTTNVSSFLCFGIISIAALAPTAHAAECAGTNNDHQCWVSGLSGPNYSLVAVGKTANNHGIACAVQSPQPDNWGGFVDCFSPIGSSGAAIKGRAGQYAQNPGPFSSSDPNKRIVSMTIRAAGFGFPANEVFIYALRSDGAVFLAATLWPLGDDPRIYFNTQFSGLPSGLRSIQWVSGVGLLGVTSSNAVYSLGLSSSSLLASNVVLTSNNIYEAYPIALAGSTGTSQSLSNLNGGAVPPMLPAPLRAALSDPNQSFFRMGRDTPLTMASATIYAAMEPTACGRASNSHNPCILRSIRTNGAWSAWTEFQTGDIFSDPSATYGTPFSIQDGSSFRGVAGEIWAIAGPFHLRVWVP